jgi:multicomponent Na+:H+ antiporter subunit E
MESKAKSGGRVGEKVALFVVLLVFWLLLNASLAADVIIVGVIAAFLITLVFNGGMSVLSGFNATPRAVIAAVIFIFYFFKELIISNLRMAAIILAPSLPVNPGIVKVRTKLKSPVGRELLANAITMTPGTLTIELIDEWLYVHWVTVESNDVETATATIVAGFERYLEVMYG